MNGVVARLRDEIRKVLVAAAFFSTGFCLIHVANRLLTEGSSVEIAGLTRAIIGGLIVAKVLIMVNFLPFVNAFAGRRLVASIAWKTGLYLCGGVVVLYIEPFLKKLVKGAGLSASHLGAWQELMLPRTGATLIWVGMLLAFFVTFQEVGHAMGKDQFKDTLLGKRKRPAAAGSRKAA